MRREFLPVATIVLVVWLLLSWWWSPAWLLGVILLPAFMVGVYDMFQREHSLRRNFPLVGRARWLMEKARPYLRQYLFESETDGTPVNRMFRSVVYQRAKGAPDTIPFGTKMDTYRDGYEWIAHSIGAIHIDAEMPAPRIDIGGPDCRQPYGSSLLNSSAMSFGSLSPNAVRAMNGAAKLAGFAQNTGEGGISDYHLEYGGDLIWQIGTGYFGCRTLDGDFDPDMFEQNAAREAVRMIEIKLSQGAKPGHGGILPAIKNTEEIARIRGVKPHTTVASPPGHTAFTTPLELMRFIERLRGLSEGKPIGFKLCVGRESEVVALCKAMVETGITPDFITVDGGEGGTGAAPLEFCNSIGMPLRDGLAFVCDCLTGFGLKERVRVIASGKIFTGFHIAKNLAIGADLCNSARGFMLSLGCVQSLVCNTNHCPTGVATQDPVLEQGLVVSDKRVRAARYHRETVHNAREIVGAAGLDSPADLNRTHIFRRVSQNLVQRYDELFPYADAGSLLAEPWPPAFEQQMSEARTDTFRPAHYVARHAGGFRELDDAAPTAH